MTEQTPRLGDTWRPALRRGEVRTVAAVTDDVVTWQDRHGDEYRNSLASWTDWVERVGARREATV